MDTSYRRPDTVLIYLYRRGNAATAVASETATTEVAVRYLLLQRHPKHTQSGDIWQTVVGSVRWGEERIEAARREVFEETGLTLLRGVTAIGYAFSFPIHLPEDQESWYPPGQTTIDNTVYAAETVDARPVRLCPEHQAYGWFTFEEALGKLHWEEEKEGLLRLHPMIQVLPSSS
jgi:dATP pyrophosphohydrolase